MTNYEKRYNIKIELDKIICLDCNKEIKYLGYAVGNKTAEGECLNCGKWVRFPIHQIKENKKDD